ncbi:MAG: efflux RND transporter periplasmic adaptor subunit, partial [Bacteroidetes bacterium CG_4_8_14_3_um_filter_31_14]
IQADERLIKTIPAHIPGRIEKLFTNFTGEQINKGQIIASIYSPELITAQQELFEALKLKDIQPQIIEAAKEKLKQWKLTDNQIEEIEKSKKIKSVFDVVSSVSGVIINRKINLGDYVQTGTPLFEVSDLIQLWGVFDAYENDLPWMKIGSKLTFTLQAIPGKEFSGNI